jgi:hypothetical protein
MALVSGDPSGASERRPFEFKEGDRVVVCVEDTAVKQGDKAPYAKTVLRVVCGPTNDPGRYAGPVRGTRDGKPAIWSKVIWENISFSTAEFCQQKVLAMLRALGHLQKVHIEDDADWKEATLDRECAVTVTLEEYKGRTNAKVKTAEPLTREDYEMMAQVYNDFGTARGCGWNLDEGATEPLHPWSYDGAQQSAEGADAAGRRGFGGGRRSAPSGHQAPAQEQPRQAPAPARVVEPEVNHEEPEEVDPGVDLEDGSATLPSPPSDAAYEAQRSWSRMVGELLATKATELQTKLDAVLLFRSPSDAVVLLRALEKGEQDKGARQRKRVLDLIVDRLSRYDLPV